MNDKEENFIKNKDISIFHLQNKISVNSEEDLDQTFILKETQPRVGLFNFPDLNNKDDKISDIKKMKDNSIIEFCKWENENVSKKLAFFFNFLYV